MRRILIFGATGSIGQQALSCIDDMQLVGITFNNNLDLAKKIKNQYVNIEVFSPSIQDLNTVSSYEELILKTKPDIILNAIVGFEGVYITKLSIENNIDIALANKESLVIAGWYFNKILKNKNVKIYPVDSEHSSLYELMNYDCESIKRIYITASGGPFYKLEDINKLDVTFDEAINHPKWKMGYKISIDSSNLINKCFELIEAHYLYNNVDIKAVYHPQAIIHSLVEFKNNSVLANMSNPDMKISIDLALNNFKKRDPKIDPIDFSNLIINFENIDENKWKPIKWAYELISNHFYIIGLIISVLDDYLIECFRTNKIKYNEIISIMDIFIEKYKLNNLSTWDDILEWTQKILNECKQYIEENYGKN